MAAAVAVNRFLSSNKRSNVYRNIPPRQQLPHGGIDDAALTTSSQKTHRLPPRLLQLRRQEKQPLGIEAAGSECLNKMRLQEEAAATIHNYTPFSHPEAAAAAATTTSYPDAYSYNDPTTAAAAATLPQVALAASQPYYHPHDHYPVLQSLLNPYAFPFFPPTAAPDDYILLPPPYLLLPAAESVSVDISASAHAPGYVYNWPCYQPQELEVQVDIMLQLQHCMGLQLPEPAAASAYNYINYDGVIRSYSTHQVATYELSNTGEQQLEPKLQQQQNLEEEEEMAILGIVHGEMYDEIHIGSRRSAEVAASASSGGRGGRGGVCIPVGSEVQVMEGHHELVVTKLPATLDQDDSSLILFLYKQS